MECFKLTLALICLLSCWHKGEGQLPPGVLLDLNAFDSTTLSYENEYQMFDEVVFLSDPNNTNMTEFSAPSGNWTALFVLILNGNTSIEDVDVYLEEAFMSRRLDKDYRGLFSRSQISNNSVELVGLSDVIDPSQVSDGMLIEGMRTHPDSGGDEVLSEDEINIALKSVGYLARRHPGYDSREICLVAVDPLNTTTACVTLFFIGLNDDPPTITYTPLSNVSFTEGDTAFVEIIDGDIAVSDPDHPTRYLMQYAQARINGFTAGDPEILSVTYENPGFAYDFDSSTGILTITGNATVDVYSELLANITYLNNMMEPYPAYRTITLTVNDGMHTSNPVEVVVMLININDAPAVSLQGEDPVITDHTISYTEGSGSVVVLPNAFVIDTDPTAMIQRLDISLENRIDGDFESISITSDLYGLTLDSSSSPNTISLNGLAPQMNYTNVLRSLVYNHSDASPGNPTTSEPRIIEFFVQDDQSAISMQNSTLFINIIPVNDPPILLYVSDPAQRASTFPILAGQATSTFMFTEDDSPINFGRDIYLRDVDGNISNATLWLTGLLDGIQDSVTVNESLLNGLVFNRDDNGNESVITIEGEATPYQYEEVLRSLAYQNLYTTNQVTDGQRNITIATTDSGGLYSDRIYAYITVMDRNDGPGIDLGGGEGRDYTVTFIEDGQSVPLALAHIIDIMDEELHNISSLTLNLTSPNAQLDPEESIFIRSPVNFPFTFDFDNPPTTTYINFVLNASVEAYEEALRSVYYYNARDEPTLFSNGSNITRVVIIQITDANFVPDGADPNADFNADLGVSMTTIRVYIEIEPINDKRPRILIRAVPDGCARDSREGEEAIETANRRRRDVRSVSRIRKRSVGGVATDRSMAPMLDSAQAYFTQLEHSRCIQSVTLKFNSNTSTPVVEVPKLLNKLLTFDPPELNAADKFGVWMDHKTLVVFFTECVDVGRKGERERVVNVAFESERGSCQWSTPCTNGICFSNNTGCPITGYYQINTICPQAENSQEDLEDDDVYLDNISSRYLFFVLLLAICLFVVVMVGLICRTRYRVQSPADKLSSSSLPTKHSPASTSINMTTSSSPSAHTSKSNEKSFIQDVPRDCKMSQNVPKHSKVDQNVPKKNSTGTDAISSCKNAKKHNRTHTAKQVSETRSPTSKGTKPVSETSLSASERESERLLPVDGFDSGGEDDDRIEVEKKKEEVERLESSHDQSRDQSCDCNHGDNSGHKHRDCNSSHSSRNNNSSHKVRPPSNRLTSTDTIQQYSKH